MMTPIRQVMGLIGWLLLCFAVAAIGGVASMDAPSFYAQLTQPSWAPPAAVFGPAWTVLYTLMAIAAWVVWRSDAPNKATALWLFGAQLSLNMLWSWLFFAWQLGFWSCVDIVALLALIVATLHAFYRINRLAAALLIPYLLWVSFAAVLNYTLWQLNPQLLT